MNRVLLFIAFYTALYISAQAQFSISAQQLLCNNVCTGSAHINAPPANSYRYLWNTGDTSATISNLCAGTYQCIVSDTLGTPLDTSLVTLQQPPALVFTPAILKNNLCYADTSGCVKFAVTGGTGTRYSFTWSTGYQGYLGNGDQFPLTAGNYSITITDANACTASTTFSLTQPPAIVLAPQVTNTTGCGVCNGAISVSVSGGTSSSYRYNWSTGATGASLSGICAGGYRITVTDTSGCTNTANIPVFASQSSLSASFSTVTNIDCSHNMGYLYAAATGGTAPYHFNWSTGSTAPDIFNLQAGVYQVSITDSLGCFAVAIDTIQNNGVVINTRIQQNFRCDNNKGKIAITVSQGTAPYLIHWNNVATTDSIDGLSAGNYSVTVTDNAGCTASQSYTIAQINNTLLAQTTATSVSCQNLNNGSAYVTLTGGLPPFNYLWNTSPYQTTDTATGMPAGNYQVRVIDAFGCSVFAAVNITNNYNQVSTTTHIGNCDSIGSATASIAIGQSPYAFLWSTQPQQSTATANNMPVGNYTVSVTDAVGCVRTGHASLQFSCAGMVTGTVFYDNNANCHKDVGEQGISGVPVLVTNHNITFEGTTNLSGQYAIPVTATGGYRILTGVNASSAILQYGNAGCGYLEACPASDTITFVTLRDTFQNYNFGYVGTADFDLAINAGWTAVDASHQKEYWILYANQAFLTPYTGTATVTFNYDPNLVFQSGVPTPIHNITNHTLTWTVDSLPSPTFDWTKRLRAFFTVPTNLASTCELKNDFHIQPYTADCDTNNNSVYTEEIAGLPEAPFYKEAHPPGDMMPGDSILTYTIHFQNTGLDTARIIKVTDSLSPYLDPASVVNIASSPLYTQFYIAPGAVLTWVFNAAGLPGSATNPLTSAGFISFTAKLKPGTNPGYTVKNSAGISFGNNTPVVTNTTANYIAFPASVIDVPQGIVHVHVFPNPFSNTANVVIDGITDTYDFELTDLTGRVVQKLNALTTNRFTLNRNELTAGIYVYFMYSHNQPVAYGKVVVQ